MNYVTETLKITHDDSIKPSNISELIEPLGYTLTRGNQPEATHDNHNTQLSAEDMGMSADEHAAHL